MEHAGLLGSAAEGIEHHCTGHLPHTLRGVFRVSPGGDDCNGRLVFDQNYLFLETKSSRLVVV